jgi:hypothetical protein
MGGNPGHGNGAYPSEMDESVDFMYALRAAVPSQPHPGLAAALIPRLASTARTATLEAETRETRRMTPAARVARRPRSRRALVARVGIAIALLPLLLAGLAVAGVTVPSPARSAFDSVGIKLPNQPSKKSESTSEPSTQAPASTPGTEETGRSSAQSQGKSEAAHQGALEQRAKAKGKAVGHDRGEAIGLKDLIPPGQTGQTGPPAHSNAGGSSGGNSATKPPKSTHTPKGVAKGHTKTPPSQSK